MFGLKRAALLLGGLGLAGSLVYGASFALFTSAAGNQSNTFAAGTVSLTKTAGTDMTFNNMAPGDTQSNSYTVSYSGSLPAWVGLDTSASGTLITPPTGDTNATNDALQVTITDSNSKSFSDDQVNQLVYGTPVNSGWTDTFTVTGALPSAAGNDDQGATGTVTLTAHSVQSANNTNADNSGPTSWQ